MMNDEHFLSKMMDRQKRADAIEQLCRQHGAGFVIEIARAFIERKEQEAAREHAKWRDEMMKAANTPAKPEAPPQPERGSQ